MAIINQNSLCRFKKFIQNLINFIKFALSSFTVVFRITGYACGIGVNADPDPAISYDSTCLKETLVLFFL